MRLLRLTAAFASSPWALEISTLNALAELLQNARSESEARGAIMARSTPAQRSPGGGGQRENVAVIPILGVITHRGNMVVDICGPGATSTQLLDQAIRAAAADPSIRSIVLDVDSPGGSVFGVQELAATIMESRAMKPIAAVANSTASSAAYWIASAAHEIYVTPSGEVGSIGVFGAHVDTTKADEASGKTTTIISAGKFKAEGIGPLTDDARAHMQARVDDYYTRFVRDVARTRNVPVETVRNGYGEGRTLGAQAALAAGMVDGIATLAEVVGRYARRTAETANKGRRVAMSSSTVMKSLSVTKARMAIAAVSLPPVGAPSTPERDAARAAIEKAAQLPPGTR